MSIGVHLLASGAEVEFHWHESPKTGLPTLVVLSPGLAHGRFKAATRTVAGTTTIVTPEPGGSIILTDLLISSQKFSLGAVKVQFTDGTDTVVIFDIDVTDAPVAVALPFNGRWEGWQDAQVDMVTTLDPAATVSIGYIHISSSLTFAEWDALR